MKESALLRYAKSSELMDISLVINGDKIKFNLFKELVINPNILNRELRDQSISHSFLVIAHKNMVKSLSDHELEVKRYTAKKWTDLKGGEGRQTKDDLRQRIEADPRYIMMQKKSIKLTYQKDILEACIRSFEQRSSMLQTLSANTRRSL